MTDGQELWLVLAALYLLECVAWSGARTFLFLSGWWGHWKLGRPSAQGGKGTPRLAFPLPPMGWAFVTEVWPFSLSPDGLSPVVLAAPNPGKRRKSAAGSVFPWAEAAHFPWPGKADAAFAKAWKRVVDSVATAEAPNREGVIKSAILQALDVKGVQDRLLRFRERTGALRTLGNILFCWWFLMVPLAAMRFGIAVPGPTVLVAPVLVALGGLLQWIAAFLFFRLHRKMTPGDALERWQHAVLVALVPTHAIRAVQLLARDWLAGFHPLAVAFATLPREKAVAFAASVWRDAVHPLAPDGDPAAAAAAVWFHEHAYRPAVQTLLERENIAPATLLAGPSDAPAWCPRCLAVFQNAGSTCPDCDGVPLVDGERPPAPAAA